MGSRILGGARASFTIILALLCAACSGSKDVLFIDPYWMAMAEVHVDLDKVAKRERIEPVLVTGVNASSVRMRFLRMARGEYVAHSIFVTPLFAPEAKILAEEGLDVTVLGSSYAPSMTAQKLAPAKLVVSDRTAVLKTVAKRCAETGETTLLFYRDPVEREIFFEAYRRAGASSDDLVDFHVESFDGRTINFIRSLERSRRIIGSLMLIVDGDNEAILKEIPQPILAHAVSYVSGQETPTSTLSLITDDYEALIAGRRSTRVAAELETSTLSLK